MSALRGGEWSASHFGRITTGERTPGADGIGGRVGPRTDLDSVEIRKITWPCQKSTPATQHVARRYTEWGIPDPEKLTVLAFYDIQTRYISKIVSFPWKSVYYT
jgi:hypothetical protein